MKKIKMLLLSLLIIFSIGISINADTIEVDKPKNVSITEIKTEKSAYHQGEDIAFYIKIKGLTDEEMKNIEYFKVRFGRFQNYDMFFNLIDLQFDENTNAFHGKINSIFLEEKRYLIDIENIYIRLKNSENSVKVLKKGVLYLPLIVNNNCADGNHTIYKDNWVYHPSDIPCAQENEKTISCNICGEVVYRESVPLQDHEVWGWTNWTIEKTPTFYSEGIKTIRCARCNKIVKTQIIPKLQATIKLKFTKKIISIKKGKTIKIKYIRTPNNAQDILSWKSSKPKIVKILKNGKIKGVRKGKSIITLKTNTGKKAKVIIKVK